MGKTGYGSGVIDNKGGLIVLISRLAPLSKNWTKVEVRFAGFVFAERGSRFAGFHSRLRGKRTKDNLVCDRFWSRLSSNGSIICQRRGNRWYDIDIVGREAHAGRSKGEHANAAHDLAKKIVALSNLNYPKHEMSVNIGHIHGGQERHNIICGKASAKLDVRFASLKHRQWLHQKIHAILEQYHEISVCGQHKTQTVYQIVDDCPPFSPTRKAVKLAQAYLGAIESLEGRRVKAEAAGGAGDVNYLSRKGVVVLDGFGAVGGEMHTKREFVDVRSLGTRSAALAHFIHVIQKS